MFKKISDGDFAILCDSVNLTWKRRFNGEYQFFYKDSGRPLEIPDPKFEVEFEIKGRAFAEAFLLGYYGGCMNTHKGLDRSKSK